LTILPVTEQAIILAILYDPFIYVHKTLLSSQHEWTVADVCQRLQLRNKQNNYKKNDLLSAMIDKSQIANYREAQNKEYKYKR
jgi:hypothetical protein